MSRRWMLALTCATLTLAAAGWALPAAGSGAEESPPPQEQPRHEEVDWSMSCVECHRDFTPESTAEWEKGKHGQVNVGCFICHGDGVESFAPKPDNTSCATCHDDKFAASESSVANDCFSCHGGHTLRFHPE